MARDMVKKNAYDDEWKKKNSKLFAVRIANSTGIPSAVKAMAEEFGTTESIIIRQAIVEKLQREGYEIKE